jgi:hypothetical protein
MLAFLDVLFVSFTTTSQYAPPFAWPANEVLAILHPTPEVVCALAEDGVTAKVAKDNTTIHRTCRTRTTSPGRLDWR